jgi:hypothetical protein
MDQRTRQFRLITQFAQGSLSKNRYSSLELARDAVDLVAAAVDAPGGVVEHAIVGEYLVDGRAPTRGVVFTEDIVEIASQ